MRSETATMGTIDTGRDYPVAVMVRRCNGSPGPFASLNWDILVTFQSGQQVPFEGVPNCAQPPPSHMQELDFVGQTKGAATWALDGGVYKYAFATWADWTECEE